MTKIDKQLAEEYLNRLSNLPEEEKAKELLNLTISNQIPGFTITSGKGIIRCCNLHTMGGYQPGLWEGSKYGGYGSGLYLNTLGSDYFEQAFFKLFNKQRELSPIHEKVLGADRADKIKNDPHVFEILLEQPDI